MRRSMRLYHTGKVEIKKPDIHRGRRNADFGQGFYLSPDKEFTYRWAGREDLINIYELDLTGLKVQQFSRSLEWFEYIFSNRRSKDTVDADLVIGPIANDTIYDTLGILSSGYLKPEDALKLLMIGPEYTQVAVKSRKAAASLRWIGADRDTDSGRYAELLRKEQEEYQEAFARAMSQL